MAEDGLRNGDVFPFFQRPTSLVFMSTEITVEIINLVSLFYQVILAEKKGSDQLFAVKTIMKKKTVKNGLVKQVFTEKSVLALASGYPFLTALHSAFQTAVTVWHKPLRLRPLDTGEI